MSGLLNKVKDAVTGSKTTHDSDTTGNKGYNGKLLPRSVPLKARKLIASQSTTAVALAMTPA